MKFIYSIALILFVSPLFAQIPTGYYNTAAGLTKAPLKAALNNIIKGHQRKRNTDLHLNQYIEFIFCMNTE